MLSVIAIRKLREERDKAILDSATAKAPLHSKPRWRTGTPAKGGEYIAKFSQDGLDIKRIAYYDIAFNKWYFSPESARSIEMACTGWAEMPEEENI